MIQDVGYTSMVITTTSLIILRKKVEFVDLLVLLKSDCQKKDALERAGALSRSF